MMINNKISAINISSGESSEYSFYAYFAFQFLLVAMNMFFNAKVGVFSLPLTLLMISVVLGRFPSQGFDMKPSKNGMLYIYLIMG